MCGSDTDVEQRKLFVLDEPAYARCEIGSLLHDEDMHGSLFGEVVHAQYAAGHGIGHLVSQLGFVHYDEVPRLYFLRGIKTAEKAVRLPHNDDRQRGAPSPASSH